MAGRKVSYNGVQHRSFLGGNWYNGCTALVLGFCLTFGMCVFLFDKSLQSAAGISGGVGFVAAVAALTQHERFEIDAALIRYRTYTWILGLHFGQWLPLPVISEIVARSRTSKHFIPLNNTSAQPKLNPGFWATEYKWQVLLRVEHSPTGIIAAYVPQKQALADAATLGKLFDVAVTVEQ